MKFITNELSYLDKVTETVYATKIERLQLVNIRDILMGALHFGYNGQFLEKGKYKLNTWANI